MSEKHPVHLLKKQKEAENTMSFYLEKPDEFIYKAGQTIDLIIPSLVNNTRTFSLITEPQEDYLAVATRITNSEFKQTLKEIEVGGDLEIKGPFGSFMLHQDSNKSAVFLVGGIGITPFVSMIRDALKNKKSHKLYLFYSNRRPEDTAFFQELETLSKNEDINLTFVPTMTNMEKSAKSWSGETTYIDWSMIKKYVPETEDVIYYTAGPQKMVSAMRKILEENHISEDYIKFEEFPGY